MRRELDNLKSTYLVDEEERPLKSLLNYKEAIQNIRLLPEIREYMAHYALHTTGDWPTWYFQKKLIAQVNTPDSKTGEK